MPKSKYKKSKKKSRKKRIKSKKQSSSKLRKPLNQTLYNKVKEEAKRRFKVWPSAYASGWLVSTYKKRGGKFSGQRKSSRVGISRWFREKWINVCKLPKIVDCGRSRAEMKNYPYCRPLYRVSPGTPKTAREIPREEIKRRCKKKRASPMKRIMPNKKSRKINKY